VGVFVGILMTIHGLITLVIGSAVVSGAAPVPGAASLPGAGWYPVPLGQSWLLQGDAARIGGVLWVIAGLGLIATAASIFGFIIPTSAWRVLGLVSAVSGLAALVAYFHPYYAIAVVVNLAILAAATLMEERSRDLLGI
jgi:hypothetical protein